MSRALRAEAEHVVVGGGVIGLSLAYELLRRGGDVLLVERDQPGGGATGCAAGMLAPISEAGDQAADLVAFGVESLRRYPAFVSGLEQMTGVACAYRDEGTLWVALDRDQRAELTDLFHRLDDRGLTAREIDAEKLRQVEPHLSRRILGGLRVAGDHQVDPRRLCRALLAAVERLGGRIASGLRVQRVVTCGSRAVGVSGMDADGVRFGVQAQSVVLAAGAWSEQDLSTPLPQFGLRAVKGQLLRLRGPLLLNHIVRTPRVYLVPRSDGELLVGATTEELGFDRSATAGAAMELLRAAWEVVPAIYDAELVETTVGLRPAVDDHLPVIGSTGTEGLFVAFGHYRHGILLAPATAHYLASEMRGEPPARELKSFRASRFDGRDPARAPEESSLGTAG